MATDIKPLAERVGSEVFGRTIHWRVETKAVWRGKRPDIVMEFADDKRVIITGEAKRPDDPKGVTPLQVDEVDGAITKAQKQGSAAFPQVGQQDSLLRELRDKVPLLFASARLAILGESPPLASPASETWVQLRSGASSASRTSTQGQSSVGLAGWGDSCAALPCEEKGFCQKASLHAANH